MCSIRDYNIGTIQNNGLKDAVLSCGEGERAEIDARDERSTSRERADDACWELADSDVSESVIPYTRTSLASLALDSYIPSPIHQ
jgi:hypothetical protein